MPNYNGKFPLGMICPRCGKLDNHPIEKTYPKNYHPGKDTVETFKRIAGRDITYRLRTKKCVGCAQKFDSAEIPHEHLRAVVKELLRLLGVQSDLHKAQQQIDEQNERFQKITDIALSEPKT